MPTCRWMLVSVALSLLLTSGPASGAFCALRDPVQAINALYPASTGFRSIVRSIGADTRKAVSDRLAFELHFNELGRHTLYVAVNDDAVPLGLVHVRSELAGRSLVEISWSMNLDYEIADMQFQRCRSRLCDDPVFDRLTTLLRGRNIGDVQGIWQDLPATYSKLGLDASDPAAVLVEAALRSAMKTLVITEFGWRHDIAELQRASLIAKYLAIDPASTTLQRIAITDAALTGVEQELNGDTVVERDTIEAYSVLQNGKELARIAQAKWRDGERSYSFRWLIDPTDRIVGIDPSREWPTSETESAFQGLVGRRLVDSENCGTAAELAGFELTYVTASTRR